MMEYATTAALIGETLARSGYDYDVELHADGRTASATVLLIGDRQRWLDEEPRVLAHLRANDSWRTLGVLVKYRFMDRNALAL